MCVLPPGGVRAGHSHGGEHVLPQLDQRLHVGSLSPPNHAICHRQNATGPRVRDASAYAARFPQGIPPRRGARPG